MRAQSLLWLCTTMLGLACAGPPASSGESSSDADADTANTDDATGTDDAGTGFVGGTDLPEVDRAFAGVLLLDGELASFQPCSGTAAPLTGVSEFESAAACSVPLFVQFLGRFVEGPEPRYEVTLLSGGPCREGQCEDPIGWTECRPLPSSPGAFPWFEPLCTTPAGCGFGCFEPESTSCPGGEKCTLATCGGASFAACRPAGTAAEGEGCFGDPATGVDSCELGSLCRGGQCQASCSVAEPDECDASAVCVDVGAALGICATPCDPLAPACAPLQDCLERDGQFVCWGA